MKLAISSYSFHRLGKGPEEDRLPDFEALVRACRKWGIDGLELLGVHFGSTEGEYLNRLRQEAFQNGIALAAVSAHHNFVQPDPDERRRHIDILCGWVDVAHALGAPAVRAFGGRWGTRRDFSEFMAARGEEPPLPGYTDDDAHRWVAEAFGIAAYYAGRKGVTLVLENHWGFTGTAAGVLRILEDVGSPWLKVALDTGNFNFCDDPYREMEILAPHAAMVHAKTYIGGGLYYSADLDYRRIGQILEDAGFGGWVSLEAEGAARPEENIAASLEELRRSLPFR
jgi:L-ribulose-5-phosphate 3-epimerase